MLVRAGFKQLGRKIRSVKDGPGALTALEQAVEIYIGFAQRTPTLFQVMFSFELMDPRTLS